MIGNASSGPVRVLGLHTEYRIDPLGIDVRLPRLGWRLESDLRGVTQSAYQVQVATSPHLHTNESDVVWDTGRVAAASTLHVVYGGTPLKARRRYFWRVRVWFGEAAPTEWSATAWWEMGLLEPADWSARWIEPDQSPALPEPAISFFEMLEMAPEDDAQDYHRLNPPQLVRQAFPSTGAIRRARIYATAHGVYRLTVNGQRAGREELAPEPTSYDRYLQFQTYDVTQLIGEGENVVGAVIGDGWWAGRIGLPGDSCQYGDRLALLAQLEIDYADGRRATVCVGDDAVSSTGRLVYSDLFIGERQDSRLAHPGWDQPGFDAASWVPVHSASDDLGNLVAQAAPPIVVLAAFAPAAILRSPSGETIVDAGQVIHGRLWLTVEGEPGDEVVLDHTEVLDTDGELFRHLIGRNKDQRDVFVLKGGIEVLEPVFATHGFRYVRVRGLRRPPTIDEVRAVVLGSDLPVTADFSCSDDRLNQLFRNVVWSQRGNFVGIPTDCPQRERAGWTGDAQAFVGAATLNMDVDAFMTRWLRNLVLEQRPDGQVPLTVPYPRSQEASIDAVQGGSHSSAGWGDAVVLVPWALYRAYGDTRVLEETWPAMQRWLAYAGRQAEGGHPERLGQLGPDAEARQKLLWNTGFHFGDWLIPSLTAGYQDPFAASGATKEIASSCFYAASAGTAARIAEVLGRPDDAVHYEQLANRIAEAFAAEYIAPDGRLPAHFQGMYVLALWAGVVPAALRPAVTEQLVTLIEANGDRLDTGFLSTPHLLPVLCENGRADVAFRLLLQTACPSWLYEVEHGATTVWETWDAIAADGQPGRASFNHYATGAVSEWLIQSVAGLDPTGVHERRVRVAPVVDDRIARATVRYDSVLGPIGVDWERRDGAMRISIEMPANTQAAVRLPGASVDLVVEDASPADGTPIGLHPRQDGDDVLVDVPSGRYEFRYRFAGRGLPPSGTLVPMPPRREAG